MTDDLTVELAAGVLTVTFTRPAKKNAITNEMYRDLADAVERAEVDPAVRVLVFRAEGELFTAGNDLGEFAAMSSGAAPTELHGGRFIHALATSTTPLVAAVQGKAVGIGTTMLLHCDHVLLTEDAQLITPFVNLALVPEAASSLLLVQRIGYLRAFDMFALAQPMDAASAVSLGLANAMVPRAELHDRAEQVAQRLAAQPAGALRATKRLMREAASLQSRVDAELRVFREQLRSPEAREAFDAFAQKRPADFTKFG